MSFPEHQGKKTSPEGDIVYRRVAASETTTPPRGPGEPRLDPTLLPLLVGCALLLLFVIVLGNLSIRRVQDTSREVLNLQQHFNARAELLLHLRIALTRLDNEARDKMEAQAREELRPPFDMRLSTARNELTNRMPSLGRPPLSQLPKWQTFHRDLEAYVETTRDADNYSLNGFAQFQAVDRELNELIQDNGVEQRQVFDRSEQLANAAVRSIKIWTIIAILAGLFVTAATVLAAQRRYRQTRESVEAARREREFSNQMLEGMVSAVAAIDRHDRIRSANSAFFKIFPRVAIGSSIHDQNDSTEGMKLLESATASHVVASTYRGRWNLADNGATHTFDVYSSPIEIDNQNGQILTLVDVTEAAKSEAALRRTEALAAVGEAAAQLAHEIKNPLGSIRLGVEMLREYTTAEEAHRTITLVERGIQHLNKLVVDVTQFSRRRELDRTEVDLHETIDASIDLVADRIKEKETPIEKRYASTEISGVWDQEQLSEVFVNIFANAIDASEVRAPLKISTEVIDPGSSPALIGAPTTITTPRVRIEISDRGAGMDEKTVSRLFEPFFTTKKRGTGLGLSIVRQIIDLHSGSIDVQSERGKGTTFTIELPLNNTNVLNPT
ncbi:MAG TPA: ATP-binding protein [Pyrinomonadaceae bacterium]|nr:ATP-binding protein [Pyrinomonadaceae bacterium]